MATAGNGNPSKQTSEGHAMNVKRALSAMFLAGIFAVPSISLSHDNDHDDRNAFFSELTRIRIGFQIAPVPLNLRGKDKALVGLGSYIVNAQSGCNDCHTNPPFAPGGNPFAGEPKVINADQYLAGGTPFGPTIVSRNITPDEFGRPAGLTFPEFRQLMRTGRDPDDPNRLLQVMPWPIFGEMSNRDLRAIYEYLRAIPSLPDNSPPPPPPP
jgi:hypothetical protein